MKTPLKDVHEDLSEKSGVYKELREMDKNIRCHGLYQNPYTWITFPEIDMLWKNIQNRLEFIRCTFFMIFKLS